MKSNATTSSELSEIFDAMWSQIRSANLTSGQPRGSASTESVSLARFALRLARSKVEPLYAKLGNVYQRLGGSARALDYHQKAQVIFHRQKDKRAMAQCFINAAICLSLLDRFEESERSYRQSERLSKELGMSELQAQ